MDTISPLSFAPIVQPYVWGGRRLASWFPDVPAHGPVAEVWLVSDEEKDRSVVSAGPLAGASLRDLIARFGPRLLGPKCGGRFPVLLKLLDAREVLSVQVHPTDEQAARLRPGTLGKTEAWVILDAEPGSLLYLGLKPGIDRSAFEQAVRSGTVPDVLHSFQPRPGDVVFVPAGTVHAIGAGLLLFEIQQTSDNTFRLHDWGRGRPVHVDEGLACIDFQQSPADVVEPVVESTLPVRRERLIECPYFRLWRYRGERPFAVGAAGECRVIVVVEGTGSLHVGNGVFPLRPGACWLVPAEVGVAECRPDGAITLLECGLPQ